MFYYKYIIRPICLDGDNEETTKKGRTRPTQSVGDRRSKRGGGISDDRREVPSGVGLRITTKPFQDKSHHNHRYSFHYGIC